MRRGFTIVEALVGMSVLVLALAMMHGFYASASAGTGRSIEASDALRSVLVAGEFMRNDLGEMAFRDIQKDISIDPAKKAFSVRIPPVLSADLWKGDYVPVSYELERLPGGDKVHRLIRRLGAEAKPLANCLLRDMIVRVVPTRGAAVPFHPAFALNGVSAYQAYLEVTLVGLGSMAGKATYTSTVLHPLTYMLSPDPYRLLTGAP